VCKRLHGVGQFSWNSKSTGKLYLLCTKNECLLFHHGGDQHFLSQVWFSGTKTTANSSLEFKRRALGEAGQSVIRQLLSNEARTKGVLMFEGLFGSALLLILGIALLVFEPKKLPELGKGTGDGIRGFRSAMKEHAYCLESEDQEL
jgi:sec-independent protein translocase protein TatA